MRVLLVLLLSLVGATQSFAYQVKVAEAPFNDLSLTVWAIESAKKQLLINIYDLSSKDIAAAIVDRVKAGVQVTLLEEGQPVRGMSKAAHAIETQIVKAMSESGNDDHMLIMTSKNPNDAKRRYHFDHAKYVVIDSENLLLGSENYSPTGSPTPGTKGNRGWQIYTNHAELAAFYANIFAVDTDTRVGDVVDMTSSSSAPAFGDPVFMDDAQGLAQMAEDLPVFEATNEVPIVSPETSLDKLTSLINAATASIDLQQMTFDARWGQPDTKSPLLDAVVAAARRGVRVRVLLNDETVFDHDDQKPGRRKNQETVDILNQLAQSDSLPIEAKIADVAAMGVDYIHNKGALIDGRYTLVSSINWDENAVLHNREAAVVLDSADIFAHYESLFDKDWSVSNPAHREMQTPSDDPSDPYPTEDPQYE